MKKENFDTFFLAHPSGQVDDVGRLVLLKDGLCGLHVP